MTSPTWNPNERQVDQDTGLEYEDFAAKLCGEPAKSTRNGNIREYRQRKYAEHAVRAYWQAFDGPSKSDFAVTKILGPSREFGRRHGAGIAAAQATGCFGPASYREEARKKLNAHLRDKADEIVYAVLAGNLKFKAPGSDDFGVVTIDVA